VRTLGGLVVAAGTAAISWLLVRLATANLPRSTGQLAAAIVLTIAIVIGFLAGAAIVRRASRDRTRLALFGGLSGGIAGGVVGCAYALTLTAAYLSSYSTWPQDRADQVFVVLAYPVFGGLGFCLGACIGLALGVVAGGVARVATVGR
jgi:predicted PurR-regulated permease PerM